MPAEVLYQQIKESKAQEPSPAVRHSNAGTSETESQCPGTPETESECPDTFPSSPHPTLPLQPRSTVEEALGNGRALFLQQLSGLFWRFCLSGRGAGRHLS